MTAIYSQYSNTCVLQATDMWDYKGALTSLATPIEGITKYHHLKIQQLQQMPIKPIRLSHRYKCPFKF